MFTGIIETTGLIRQLTNQGNNYEILIESPISSELKIDQSVAHDGVCLTIDQLGSAMHRVTVIEETLKKSAISTWTVGRTVNIERSMLMNGRLDGHIVQGHVDAVIHCQRKEDRSGSWVFTFDLPEQYATLVVEKGSIALNGISLTVFDVSNNSFSVGIIPYTLEHTNMKAVQPGDAVNVEFDILGKYANRIMSVAGQRRLK